MRGTSNTQTSGMKYLSFLDGKFTQKVEEGTQGAEARKNKNDVIVHELRYDTLGGQIIKMETEASEYGKQLNVIMDVSTIEEPEAKIKLRLSLSSGPAKGLLSRLPVIDFSQDVLLKGFKIERKDKPGKFGTYLVPYQNGNKLEPFYTKDNPNGLPPMKKIKVKGVDVWDDTDQIEFYEGLISSTKFPEAPTVTATSIEDDETEDEAAF